MQIRSVSAEAPEPCRYPRREMDVRVLQVPTMIGLLRCPDRHRAPKAESRGGRWNAPEGEPAIGKKERQSGGSGSASYIAGTVDVHVRATVIGRKSLNVKRRSADGQIDGTQKHQYASTPSIEDLLRLRDHVGGRARGSGGVYVRDRVHATLQHETSRRGKQAVLRVRARALPLTTHCKNHRKVTTQRDGRHGTSRRSLFPPARGVWRARHPEAPGGRATAANVDLCRSRVVGRQRHRTSSAVGRAPAPFRFPPDPKTALEHEGRGIG